jgi:hypothetical protein
MQKLVMFDLQVSPQYISEEDNETVPNEVEEIQYQNISVDNIAYYISS